MTDSGWERSLDVFSTMVWTCTAIIGPQTSDQAEFLGLSL
ncbi:hypothetical protein SAMN05444414_102202 [Roseovarius marisflavi]|uniref:Uncharacterized protein n=1 Tax=Roseovarius marisflavi TaxID=1054996 RepID=A0A1M6W9Q3_9RHOB|nr:hypothetical protein SAMN05444414_102202 [Roseovarius marisflavi]